MTHTDDLRDARTVFREASSLEVEGLDKIKDPKRDLRRAFEFEDHVGRKQCFRSLSAQKLSGLIDPLIDQVLGEHIPRTKLVVQNQESLYDYLLRTNAEVSEKVEALQPKIRNDLIRAEKEGLGWYTMEQEADEIGLELMIRLGLSPDVLIKENIENSSDSPKAKSECMENYKSGFKKSVYIGGTEDEHHSGCYRAYNIYRELKAHSSYYDRLAKTASKSKLLEHSEWRALVNSAK